MKSHMPVLFQPYPAYTNRKRQFLQCMVTGLVVFCMLYLLEPFNFNLVSDDLKARYALLYGLIAFAVTTCFTIVLPRLFPGWYDERHWRVYKEILNISALILTIALVNMKAQQYLYGDQVSLRSFARTIMYVLPVAALPVSLAVLIKQRVLYRRYRQAGADMNALLQEKHLSKTISAPPGETHTPSSGALHEGPATQVLVLTGTNDGEVLELDTAAFRYIRSEDNYAKVCWIENGVQKSRILRNTLKNLEEKTAPFASIRRCHRGYIVNLGKLEKIVGDAQGLKIKLADIPDDIPVGKKYLHTIRERAVSSS